MNFFHIPINSTIAILFLDCLFNVRYVVFCVTNIAEVHQFIIIKAGSLPMRWVALFFLNQWGKHYDDILLKISPIFPTTLVYRIAFSCIDGHASQQSCILFQVLLCCSLNPLIASSGAELLSFLWRSDNSMTLQGVSW